MLFKRGCTYRGNLLAIGGVTYSAYGEGPKPEPLGSIGASDPNLLMPTPYKNVWRYKDCFGYVIDIGGAVTQPDWIKNMPHSTEDRDACCYDNAIETYGVCDGYYVENCYFDQVYDAAVTVQYPTNGEASIMRGRGFNMEKGIKFYNNQIFHNNALICCDDEMNFNDGKFKTFHNNDENLEKY